MGQFNTTPYQAYCSRGAFRKFVKIRASATGSVEPVTLLDNCDPGTENDAHLT
jgi:hypothetical protein